VKSTPSAEDRFLALTVPFMGPILKGSLESKAKLKLIQHPTRARLEPGLIYEERGPLRR
jgi:hypothetical protein